MKSFQEDVCAAETAEMHRSTEWGFSSNSFTTQKKNPIYAIAGLKSQHYHYTVNYY